MADTRNTNTEKIPPAEKENAEDTISSQETTEPDNIEAFETSAEIEKEKGFIGEVADDIEEGAKKVGEKATEIADIVVDKLKKGLSQAYDAGAKVVDDLSQTAKVYTEKYKAESEIKKLKVEKDLLITQLGHSILKRHLEKGKVTESFFNEKETADQFNRIEMLDKQIIKTGKLLDKAKK